MDINDRVRILRQKLGLSDIEMSKQIGLSIDEYADIEHHSDEIFTCIELQKVKRIFEILGADFFKMAGISCCFCDKKYPYTAIYKLSRDELIRTKRKNMNISRENLSDTVGFNIAEIENLENNPNRLESWPIDFIKDLSNALDLPLQVLLNIKCKKCNQ